MENRKIERVSQEASGRHFKVVRLVDLLLANRDWWKNYLAEGVEEVTFEEALAEDETRENILEMIREIREKQDEKERVKTARYFQKRIIRGELPLEVIGWIEPRWQNTTRIFAESYKLIARRALAKLQERVTLRGGSAVRLADGLVTSETGRAMARLIKELIPQEAAKLDTASEDLEDLLENMGW